MKMDTGFAVEGEISEWTIEDRLLQGNQTSSATIEPTDSYPPFNDRTPNQNENDGLGDKDGAARFGIIVLSAAVVVLVFVGWRSLKYWKMRRERYMLQQQSSRADAVLGDMQMVPNDDEYDDDDPELL